MAIRRHETELAVHRLADGIRRTSGQDGGTVLDIAGNRIFRLNGLGDLILECLGRGWDESSIASHVSHRYSVSEEIARRDVQDFLKVLKEYRLIQSVCPAEEA